MALIVRVVVLFFACLLLTVPVCAQSGPGAAAPGALVGRVTDTAGTVINGAAVHVRGTPYVGHTREDGSFRIANLPPGSYSLRVTEFGFAAESATVAVPSGGTGELNVRLRPAAFELERVLSVARRMGETQAAAFDRQKDADNLVTVLPGDVIRALPNYNAAEAAGRMPDVSLERDEGEGKFVQVRGTEPRLSNVTVDGVHLPGTQGGDRIVKLDDVPSDILGAIEVSKTLTADMEADAIGGSVNLVTKTPEGAPQGYVAAQYGHISLLNHDLAQGGLTYGGRFGTDQKLGFLIGGSVDRTNRVINDVEPAWNVDSTNRSYPIEWSQRDYLYYRSRFGAATHLDYRFNDHSGVYLNGLWSMFKNHGTRYVYDISATTDSAVVGATGVDTGTTLTREVSVRTPTDQLWGLTAGGRHDTGPWTVDYAANWGGTRSSVVDYRFSPFQYGGTGPAAVRVRYDASNIEMPTYRYLRAVDAAIATTPDSFTLADFDASNGLATGRSLSGQFNAQLAYGFHNRPSSFKVGARVRDDRKEYTQGNVFYNYSATTPYRLSQALAGFTDANYYQDLATGFAMGPLPDLGVTNQWEDTHGGSFTNGTNVVRNQLASFTGSERIYAGYAMNSVEFGALHLNVGVRAEVTHSDYTSHVAAKDASGTTTVSLVSGTNDYTDLFPSAQLRYAVDANTAVRAAVTRGIARPNYSDLAPKLQGSLGIAYQHNYSNLTAGNPNLKAQHAWNYDLLVERFLPSFGGVISAGVFYKALSDVILTRNFVYQGPYTAFVGYYGTQPQNGGSGHLVGVEAQWVQRLTFLPGVLSGLGFDVNWMHADSKVLVDPASAREAPLLRQAQDIANAALLYDRGPVSARVAWTYNGPYIFSYGDGTATANGDTYMYQHSQIDASVIYSLTPLIQIQAQALSLNNAQFGFFQGTTNRRFDVQREYYGQTFYIGAKYGFK
ncbi:MAG TPA: TonB-dependent receptor [Candidatus Dormibacteraeota bacterium]|nr:TonB-dependent receptor [Candidatus Dormibacteraeota bacterium]